MIKSVSYRFSLRRYDKIGTYPNFLREEWHFNLLFVVFVIIMMYSYASGIAKRQQTFCKDFLYITDILQNFSLKTMII